MLSLSIDIANASSTIQTPILRVSQSFTALPIAIAMPQTIIERIVYWAGFYGANPNLLFDVAFCESRLRPDAWNKSDPKGGAKSVFQFLQPTFDAFSKEMKFKGDVWNPDDNIRVAAWAFANGKEKHWSCYNYLARK